MRDHKIQASRRFGKTNAMQLEMEKYYVDMSKKYSDQIFGQLHGLNSEAPILKTVVNRVADDLISTESDFCDALRYLCSSMHAQKKDGTIFDEYFGTADFNITIDKEGKWIIEEKGPILKAPISSKQPVCECGKEKHGFASHSTWCDIKT